MFTFWSMIYKMLKMLSKLHEEATAGFVDLAENMIFILTFNIYAQFMDAHDLQFCIKP